MNEKTGGCSIIGVIGGVGPFAGLDFVRNIFNNTIAKCDQEHISTLLVSCPAYIPDRTKFLLGEENINPANGMFESAKILYVGGARIAVVVCNTAHAEAIFKPFSDMVHEAMPDMTIVNMLDTCAKYIKENFTNIKTIGYLATRGTYKSGVYRYYFTEKHGINLMEPEEQGKEHIMDAIYSVDYGIKAHSSPVSAKAHNILLYEGFRLLERGAEALLLACTELPLALCAEDFSVPLINPGLITARELIKRVAPKKLKQEIIRR